MKPMTGMKPMEPMKPMAEQDPWWPSHFGKPSSTGSQDGTRYAFFPDDRRLVVQQNGTSKVYDSADHRIGGVSQQAGSGSPMVFSSQHGSLRLDELKVVG